jgi:hypothetical protein
MAKGFVNLNRFKHSKTIKRESKQRADLQRNRRFRGKRQKFYG